MNPESDNQLSESEIEGLNLIRETGGIPQSEFWKELNVSSRMGSRIASKLDERGLVSRHETEYKGNTTYLIEPNTNNGGGGEHSAWVANDLETSNDALGFSTYVDVMADFLLHDRTSPPITVSVEGDWGSGKSSFMSMLKKEVEEKGGDGTYTVEFNPWKHESGEGIWAAFMLEFFNGLQQHFDPIERFTRILRLRWDQGWRDRTLFFGGPALFAFSIVFALFWKLGVLNIVSIESVAAGLSLGTIATLITIWAWTRGKFVNPIKRELESYLSESDYAARASFIEQFSNDFEDILNTHVGNDGQVFVFIDDLDRCLPQKSAELMRSINLLLSNRNSRVFFIIGMDRTKVAAGIAASNSKLLPYYHASEYQDTRYSPTTSNIPAKSIEESNETLHTYGLKFANNYLEKFIQIPFLIPMPKEDDVGRLVHSMLGSGESLDNSKSRDNENVSSSSSTSEDSNMQKETEILPPEKLENIGRLVSPVFEYNPRKIKEFMNLFRLRAMLAAELNMFESGKLTIDQLSKFVAISLKWPSLVPELRNEDKITELNTFARNSQSPPEFISELTDKEQQLLSELLSSGVENYSPAVLDPIPDELFWISPSAFNAAEADRVSE